MCQISKQLTTLLKQRNVLQYKVVEFNPGKGRYCIVFETAEGKRFLKWNDSNHPLFYKLLQKELSIYQWLDKTDITPKLLDNDIFITEYLTGDTLRTRIKKLLQCNQQEEIYSVVTMTFSLWQHYIVKISNIKLENEPLVEPSQEYWRYMSFLLCSGPFEEEENRYLKTIRGYIFYIFKLFNLISARMLCSKIGKNSICTIHGDMHCNNIITSNGSVYIIDFENVRRGVLEFEFAYLYSQIKLLLRNNKLLINHIDAFIYDELYVLKDHILLKAIICRFDKIIKFNKKFY